MKALSLWQPWASLIFGQIRPNLFKRWETRSWYMGYRGPLLVHAAQKHFSEHDSRQLFRSMILHDYFYTWWYLPYGAIVGRVNVVACLPTDEPEILNLPLEQLRLGDFGEGRYAIKLENPALFEKPISYRGRQGLFNVPDELVAQHELEVPND